MAGDQPCCAVEGTNEEARWTSNGLQGFVGGEEEDRTPDLRIANATLSQLSYVPDCYAYFITKSGGIILRLLSSSNDFAILTGILAGNYTYKGINGVKSLHTQSLPIRKSV